MKKFIAFLFISLFVSQISAAMMPIDLNAASTTVMVAGHDHCQETGSVNHAEDGKSSSNPSAAHYCCAVVAILTASPEFFSAKQVASTCIAIFQDPHLMLPSPFTNLPEITCNHF